MKHWYAVQTKPRREDEAALNLRRQAFEAYLPRIKLSRRRKGKWTEIVEPLFPRYLFIHVDLEKTNIAPVRSTIGVTQLVRFGDHLQPIPDEVIYYLISKEDPDAGYHLKKEKTLEVGDLVEVMEGAFQGLVAIYQQASGEARAIVLLNCLGGQSRVTLSRNIIAAYG